VAQTQFFVLAGKIGETSEFGRKGLVDVTAEVRTRPNLSYLPSFGGLNASTQVVPAPI
jgi:hypothetical protein